MKIFADRDIKRLFVSISICIAAFILISQFLNWICYKEFALLLLVISGVMACSIFMICFVYFQRQNEIMENAVSEIDTYLSGDKNARIDCDNEGEMYRMFHSVNMLAAVLNAHAENENRTKEFLKETISDISHQLKTPLAALNIYNGLLQDEAENLPELKEFVDLSEQEIDRIETLVQNLLKITKLDAGMMLMEKNIENVADMMKDIELHFAYRAKQEQKELVFEGADDISFLCDRDWVIEAISNIVKNALDHTKPGNTINVEWKQFSSIVQFVVKDNGNGIHPEDINHIFKRFYRSKFSSDTKGIGLGLPLAKAIIEAHDGTVEIDSELGKGTTFTINFLIPTKL